MADSRNEEWSRTTTLVTQLHNVWVGAFLIFCALIPARAQTFQFLPELDTNVKLNSMIRMNLQAKGEREGGDPVQFQIGPSVQLYFKPLLRLKNVTAFDLDDAKARFLVAEAGYRYITAPDAPTETRMLLAITSHFPLKGGVLISDRNRADLDWKNGSFTWRYRNKFMLERTVTISSLHFIPYIAVEPYYESQYKKWSTTALYAGCLFPVGKYVQLDSYYEHENNTGKKTNQQDNEIGLAVHLYFRAQK